MKQSKLFTKTRKEAPKDEVSKNAQLLIRGGFINKEMAGVYSYLPLGLRVLKKINNIIREEMDKVGSQEIFMTALQEKTIWEKSGRWDDNVVNNWFKTNLKNGTELGLGFTHEEPIARIMSEHVFSYKDLPFSAYQIQTKFRNESRAKSGVMRGREFSMKDMYSFSKDEEEHNIFYEKSKEVYMNVFNRLGIGDKTFLTISSGQPFSKYSYEFQTVSEAGEDIIYIDDNKKIAINKEDYGEEILSDFGLDVKKEDLREEKSIEVGDIYTLGTKYSEAEGLTYKDENGEIKPVFMGSYGMSPTRSMGTLVEVNSDEKGLVWPESVAPFRVHLLSLGQNEKAEGIYTQLNEKNIEVLYDDRDVSAGEKFADADLLGIPYRVIISEKSLADAGVEIKKRDKEESKIVSVEEFLKIVK